MILGLKLDRRLMAAAGLDGERFVFGDSRFVPWRQAGLDTAVGRYMHQLLDQVKPVAIYYYAPDDPGALTTHVIRILEEQAAQFGALAKPLSKADVFGSFGLLPLRTRRALRDHLEGFWPALTEGQAHRQVALAEAAAVALVGDLHQAWPPL